MNHYPHHIGDFNSATRHLTFVERALYRELLDIYYDTEQALCGDFEKLARRVIAHSEEQRSGLQSVLDEFFVLQPDGWHNTRCDREIAAYHAKQEQQSRAGKASAGKRLQKVQPALPTPVPSGVTAKAVPPLDLELDELPTGVERTLNGRSTNQNQNQNQNHINTPQPPCGGEDAHFALAQQIAAFFPEHRRIQLQVVAGELTQLQAKGEVQAEQLLAAAAQQSALLNKEDGKACPSLRRWLREKRWLDVSPAAGAPCALPSNWRDTRSGVEAMGAMLGFAPWDQQQDKLFASYEKRVIEALQARGEVV